MKNRLPAKHIQDSPDGLVGLAVLGHITLQWNLVGIQAAIAKNAGGFLIDGDCYIELEVIGRARDYQNHSGSLLGTMIIRRKMY